MSIQPRKLKNNRTSYWVTFEYQGKTKWEHAGSSEREAERLEAQRKREVANGTYVPEVKGRVTVGAWLKHYQSGRKNRAADFERDTVAKHALTIAWFASMPLPSVRPKHMLRFVEEVRAAGVLGEKSLSTLYSIVTGAFNRAVFEELIADNPCKLPKGSVCWKSRNKRKPYTREEAHALTTDSRIPIDTRVWLSLAFYTGMREGEVCGRRWRDWIRDGRPLSGLHVHTQYDDQPLKGDETDQARPRMVPVHPELELALRGWWAEGFELVHRRQPTPDDFIVPHRKSDFGAHTKSSAYKAFARALRILGIASKTLHATRNTFISIARSNGARKEMIETVTHNSAGETIDTYTEFDWRPLCEAVALFDLSLDANAKRPALVAPAPGLEQGADNGNQEKSSEEDGDGEDAEPPLKPRAKPPADAQFDARQRRLLKLAEVDPDAARPGLAICRGVEAAKRLASGDDSASDDLTAALIDLGDATEGRQL